MERLKYRSTSLAHLVAELRDRGGLLADARAQAVADPDPDVRRDRDDDGHRERPAGVRPGREGAGDGVIPKLADGHSGTRLKGADPESILPVVVMDSGFACFVCAPE